MEKISRPEQYFLDRIRQGDQQAWSDFIGRYRGRLLRFARAKLPQRADAEDVVQDAFMAFLRSLERFRGECDLETYLFSLIRRKIIDSYRRRDARKVCLIQDAYEPATDDGSSDAFEQVASPAQTASWYARADEQYDLQKTVLAEALEELVDGFKKALRFRDLQIIELLLYCQLPNKRVAETMSIDEKTVALVKHRSLKQVRRFIEGKRIAAGSASEEFEGLLTDIWEYHRFSCPKRSTLGGFLLKTLDNAWQRYVDFHLHVLGCRFCLANLEDLESQTAEGAQQLQARIMESTVGFLSRPL